MQKRTGIYLVELYDNYGSKVNTVPADSYLEGLAQSREHMSENPDGSAVVMRVLYNTKEPRTSLS